MSEVEQWKPVPVQEFSGMYEVSDWGHVRRSSNGLILRASPTGQHHNLQIKLRRKNGQTKNFMIAHLVMGVFGEDPCGRPVGYTDGNMRNCAFENLYFPNASLANGGGHTRQMLIRSVEEIAASIWKALLRETQVFLANMPAGS